MFENAKRIVTEDAAVIISNEVRSFSNVVMVHRKWENLPLQYARECLEYLKSDEYGKDVSDPTGLPVGTYRVLRNIYVADADPQNHSAGRELHQYLALGLNIAAPITEGDSEWLLSTGRDSGGCGGESITLTLPYVDPDSVRNIIHENSDHCYDSTIFTKNDGLLSGEWCTIDFSWTIDDNEGWAEVSWRLVSADSRYMWDSYKSDIGTRVIDFSILDACSDAFEAFRKDYYFQESTGDWAHSSDGLNIDILNGEEVDPAIPLPAGFYNLDTSVSGRVAQVREGRSETTRQFKIEVHMEFRDDSLSTVWTRDAKSPQVSLVTFHFQHQDKESILKASDELYFDLQGDWYKSEDGTHYSIKNGESTPLSPLPIDAVTISEKQPHMMVTADDLRHNEEDNTYARIVQVQSTTVRGAVVMNGGSPNLDYYYGWNVEELPDFGALSGTDDWQVIPLFVLQNEDNTYTYSFKVVKRGSANHSISYGSEFVKVTETIRKNQKTIPDIGPPTYTNRNLKATVYDIRNLEFDEIDNSYSWVEVKTEYTAPYSHNFTAGDATTGEPGFVEGPSVATIEEQMSFIVKGLRYQNAITRFRKKTMVTTEYFYVNYPTAADYPREATGGSFIVTPITLPPVPDTPETPDYEDKENFSPPEYSVQAHPYPTVEKHRIEKRGEFLYALVVTQEVYENWVDGQPWDFFVTDPFDSNKFYDGPNCPRDCSD